MRLSFMGAAHEVTGSCYLLQAGEKNILIDCGMEQGRDIYENQPLPVAPGQIDALLLTHAHIDHSGRIPLLVKNGYKGPVYATNATTELCGIMLRDSGHIQEFEAEWRNRKAKRSGGEEYQPLYTVADADAALAQFEGMDYNVEFEVLPGVRARFVDVGHLLGSASIELWVTEGEVTKKLVFSGDIGNSNQPLLRDPQYLKEADYVVMESTYGDRSHGPRPDYVPALAALLQSTFDKGGSLVIPSFAVGRTQEMLYFLREVKQKGLVKGHGDFPVYVDSPLAIEATGIFLQCDTAYVDEEMKALIRAGVNPIVFPGLELAVSQDESRAINEDKTPKVIISASGMCDAGRVRHHLKHNLWRPESLVLFVGFQSPGTLGRLLVDGAKEVKLFNEDIQVNASVDVLPGVSGHADKDGLIRWLQGFEKKPELVFVNHGDPDSADSFTRCLNEELGFRAAAPYSGASFDLLRGAFINITEGRPVAPKAAGQRRSQPAFLRLVAAAERLLKACRAAEGRANKELASYAEQLNRLADKIEK